METIIKKIIIDEITQVEIYLSRNNEAITIRNFTDSLNYKNPNLNIIENNDLKEVFKEFYYSNYMNSSLQESLLKIFYENDGTTKYINLNEINISPIPLSLNNNENHFETINQSFISFQNNYAIIEAKDFLNAVYKIEDEHKGIKEIKVFSLTGASKVDEKLRETRKLFYNYKSLIDNYESIKVELQFLFKEFEKTRNILKFLREDLMNMLIDIYGDNIKATHPDFFSFDTVKWMDFEIINSNLEIEFSKIEENCQTYFSYHNDTYSNLTTSSLNRLEQMNGKKGALKHAAIDIGINALISIASTNQQANITVANLNLEIEYIKESFWDDSKKIRIDIMRLLEIYKNIKEYLVPSTQLFTKGFHQLFENEIKNDFNLIFNIDQIKPIKDRNVELSLKIRKSEIELYDLNKIVNESKQLKQIYESNINYYQNDYDYFNLNEPKEPSTLVKILSLTTAVNVFKKMHNEWDRKTIDVRNQYSYNLDYIENENIRINKYQNLINNLVKQKAKMKIEKSVNSKKINDFLKTEIDLKNKVSQNFKKIASLSQAAKNILEIKLDQKLVEISELNF